MTVQKKRKNDFTLGARSCAAQIMSMHSTHYTTGQMVTLRYSAHIKKLGSRVVVTQIPMILEVSGF